MKDLEVVRDICCQTKEYSEIGLRMGGILEIEATVIIERKIDRVTQDKI